MNNESKNALADWFFKRADPKHAPRRINGTRLEWIDGAWKATESDPFWRVYWDRQNKKVSEFYEWLGEQPVEVVNAYMLTGKLPKEPRKMMKPVGYL